MIKQELKNYVQSELYFNTSIDEITKEAYKKGYTQEEFDEVIMEIAKELQRKLNL